MRPLRVAVFLSVLVILVCGPVAAQPDGVAVPDPTSFFGFEPGSDRQLLDYGQLVEENTPEAFFNNPQHERTKLFLSQILH